MKNTTTNKKQDFQRLAEKRIDKINDAIRILGNLSNTQRYEFSDAEIALIFATLESSIAECKRGFEPQLHQTKFRFPVDTLI